MNRDELQTRLARAFSAQKAGQLDQASRLYREILEVLPDQPHALLMLGRIDRQAGRFEDARQHLERAVRIVPDTPDVLAELGYLALAQDENAAAVRRFTRLAELRPEIPDVFFNLGQAYKGIGRLQEAIGAYGRALELGISGAQEVHAELGYALALDRRLDEAEGSFRAALELDGGYARALCGLGVVRAARGDFDEAQALFRKTIAGDPDFVEAYQQLADSKRFESLQDPDFLLMQRLADDPGRSGYAREKLSFALGKAGNDCGEYDLAFGYFEAANRLKKARVPAFDPDKERAYLERIAQVFTPELLRQFDLPQAPPPHPIFIVGMPRSGTTLAEQILSAHSEVTGASEQSFFDRAAMGELSPYPDSVTGDSAAELLSIREAYLGLLSGMAAGSRFVTDKYPANFLHLGLIRILFPQAPIVHCTRSPMDTCLSIYFQDFKTGNFYAYDPADIAAMYRSYRELMQHWKAALPLAPFELEYEQLVENQEAVTRDLLRYCGLEWEDACLDFTSNRRLVDTLSRWQVRQPLYSGSVGRWRHYERHLRELESLLESA